MRKRRKALYLNSASDYSIQDHDGNVLSVEEARRRWESGEVDDWNLAFERLARICHFDLALCKLQYAAMSCSQAGSAPVPPATVDPADKTREPSGKE